MELTTGQMIDTLQVGQVAIANDPRFTHVIRNELGYYWCYSNTQYPQAWRLLQIDNNTAILKWEIKEVENLLNK